MDLSQRSRIPPDREIKSGRVHSVECSSLPGMSGGMWVGNREHRVGCVAIMHA